MSDKADLVQGDVLQREFQQQQVPVPQQRPAPAPVTIIRIQDNRSKIRLAIGIILGVKCIIVIIFLIIWFGARANDH